MSPSTLITTACHHPNSSPSSAITRLPTLMSAQVFGSGLGTGTFSAAGTIFTELAGTVPDWAPALADPVAALGEGFPVGAAPFGALAGVSAWFALLEPVALLGLLLVVFVMNLSP